VALLVAEGAASTRSLAERRDALARRVTRRAERATRRAEAAGEATRSTDP